MGIAADASITKTRRMILAAIAVMGFGLLQGARFIDEQAVQRAFACAFRPVRRWRDLAYHRRTFVFWKK